MKKIFSVILLLVVVFVVGCSTTNGPIEATDSDNSDSEVVEETETELEESESEEVNTISNDEEQEVKVIDPNAFVSFEGVDFEGNKVTNDIFKENELTLINVWGTNCGPCLEEIPYLQEINDELANDGFQIIGFLAGGESYKEDAIEILDMLDADYTNLIVPEDVFSKLGVQYIPTSFLIDSDGNVVEKRIVGALTKERYLEKINKYLK